MALQETLTTAFEADSTLQTEERIAAFEQFKTKGFPTTKNEEWKFTNVNQLINTAFDASSDASVSSDEIANAMIPGLADNALVFVNGVLSAEYSSLKEGNGLSFSALSTALENGEAAAYFGKISNKEGEDFININNALAKDGAFIKVSKGKFIESPIALYFINDAKSTAVITHPHNIIIAEENAGLKVVEHTVTLGSEKSLSNVVTEIYAAKAANVDYYKIQNDTDNASQVNATLVEQEANSVCFTHTFTLSGELIRNNLQYGLNGEHIESHMNGLYLINGKTHVDNHTVADHKFPNCESHELYKGIIDERARGVFNGKIFVRQDAQKTNAFQSNKNLLLSDDAIVNTKPQLEIWADDVSCSHGCTTGQLDQEALFYMNARGIGKEKAQSLLLEAFAGEVVDRIKIEPLKEYISNLIENRLA